MKRNSRDYIKVDGYDTQDVVKANALVQKSRYMMPILQQRTMAYIISMLHDQIISKNEKEKFIQLEYIFDIADYIKSCNIKSTGKVYSDVKETLKKLRDTSFYLTMPSGTEVLVGWLNKVWIDEKSGKVKVRLDEELAPYLFNIRDNFFTYKFEYVKNMRSLFSFRMYEILKSYAYVDKKVIFNLDVLKRRLGVENAKSYNNFALFKKYVLDVAIDEINGMTDIIVAYLPLKSGRKVVEIEFTIELRKVIDVDVDTEKNALPENKEEKEHTPDVGTEHFEEIEADERYPKAIYDDLAEFDAQRVNLLMAIVENKGIGSVYDQIAYLRIKYQEMKIYGPKNRFAYLKKIIENDKEMKETANVAPTQPKKQRKQVSKNQTKLDEWRSNMLSREYDDHYYKSLEAKSQFLLWYGDDTEKVKIEMENWEKEWERQHSGESGVDK